MVHEEWRQLARKIKQATPVLKVICYSLMQEDNHGNPVSRHWRGSSLARLSVIASPASMMFIFLTG